MFFNRLVGNGWSYPDDFFGRPPLNFYSDEVLKKISPQCNARMQGIKNPKNKLKKYSFFSELQEVEVRISVQPNFPIINLILLTVFHKFARSRGGGANTIEVMIGLGSDKKC